MPLTSFLRYHRQKKTNPIIQMLERLQSHRVFKKARIDYFIPEKNPQSMVIVLGQVHTVWKGKIGNRERNLIVRCQARLCSYYAFFEKYFAVSKFGGEGMYEGLDASFQDFRNFQLYKEVEKNFQIQHPIALEELTETAEKILHELGKEWHQELKSQSDLKRIQRFASAVSGQSLFNYLRDGQIMMYPVEGERAYQKVLEGISALGHRIEKLDQTEEMKAFRSRRGKVKNQKEIQTVLAYNSLVHEFNHLIGGDIRERATFEILRQKVQEETVVIFTMGIGHRKNYLNLTKEYFGESSTAFIFVTPPELLINWWLAIGLPFLLLLIVILLNIMNF